MLTPGVLICSHVQMAKVGHEPTSLSAQILSKSTDSLHYMAQNPAQLLTKPVEIVLDPELARVLAAWPDLPDPIRRAVLALVGSEAGEPRT